MLPRRIIGYFFISLIGMKTIVSATPLEEERKSESSPQYLEISKLVEKASHLIMQESYVQAKNQFQALALDFEQETESKVRLPYDPQFSEIVMQLTTPHFAEHAKWLKEEAGRMTSPWGLKVAVLFGSKDYIDHVGREYCAAKSHLKRIMQAIEPMLFSALLEASTPVDSPKPKERLILGDPLPSVECGVLTLTKENGCRGHTEINCGSLDQGPGSLEAAGALTFLGSIKNLPEVFKGPGTITITAGTLVVYQGKIIPPGTHDKGQLPF